MSELKKEIADATKRLRKHGESCGENANGGCSRNAGNG
jgi:hypothetical protein